MSRDRNQRTFEDYENTTLMTRDFRKLGGRYEKNEQRKMDKSNLMCDYCKVKGHTRQTCFKINGYPEWYKKMQENKNKTCGRQTTNMAECSKGKANVITPKIKGNYKAGSSTDHQRE